MAGSLSSPTARSLTEAKQRLLAKYLRGETTPRFVSNDIISPRSGNGPIPLALSQEQLFHREAGTSAIPPLYNESITLSMCGPLDVRALQSSLDAIIHRHEVWRTSYSIQKGQPEQIIHAVLPELSLPVLDLRNSPPPVQREEIQRVVGELVRRPFDFKQPPLVRYQLVRLGEFEYRLYLVAHLSVVDGVSVYQIFPEELAALYQAYSSGQPSSLAQLHVTFADYACWQRRAAMNAAIEKQLAYWREKLSGGLAVLNWPNDHPRPATQTFKGNILPFTVPKNLAHQVKQLSRREGVTLFITLLATFVTLLHSYTEQEDIIVGTPSPAGRKRSEVQRLLGYFLTPVALRFDLTDHPTFHDLLRRAQRLVFEAISNDDIPVEVLSEKLNIKSDASRTPLFSVAISLQPSIPQLGMNWSVTSMDIDSGGSPWELYIAFIDQPGAMMARVQYNPDLFYPETIHRMWHDFEQLLARVTVDSSTRISELKRDWEPNAHATLAGGA